MANFMYDRAKEMFANGQLDWTDAGTTFRLAFISSEYVSSVPASSDGPFVADILDPNIANCTLATPVMDIPSGAQPTGRTTSGPIGGPVEPPFGGPEGVLDAADIPFAAATTVAPGSNDHSLIVYRWSGSLATSELVMHFDSGTNLPKNLTGVLETVSWSPGDNRICKL